MLCVIDKRCILDYTVVNLKSIIRRQTTTKQERGGAAKSIKGIKQTYVVNMDKQRSSRIRLLIDVIKQLEFYPSDIKYKQLINQFKDNLHFFSACSNIYFYFGPRPLTQRFQTQNEVVDAGTRLHFLCTIYETNFYKYL